MGSGLATVCRHVLEGAPILVAVREEEDGREWRFGCGAEEGGEPRDGATMALEDVVRLDPSAVEIALRPRGTLLERSGPGARWHAGPGSPVLLPHRPSRRYPRFDPRYAPRPGESLDGADLRLIADVSQHGFHVALSDPGPGKPGRAHSVGLFRSWDHPEVAIFGLLPHELTAAIGRAVERVRRGERFDHGDVVEGIAEGRAVAFRRVVPRHCAAFLGHAVWYHGGIRFPAVQAVWADERGLFPWDRWFPRELRELQPVLFEPEPA